MTDSVRQKAQDSQALVREVSATKLAEPADDVVA